jgi:hypothetical protein
VFAAAALLMVNALAIAKPEYTRRTSKDCGYCHQPPGYNLSDAGKYYADHNHSLKGYAPKPKPSH